MVRIDDVGNAVISGFLGTDIIIGSITFTNQSSNGFALVVDREGVPISSFQSGGDGMSSFYAIPLAGGGFAYLGTLVRGTTTLGSISRTKSSAGVQNIFYAFTDPQGEVSKFEFADGDSHDALQDAVLTPEGDVLAYGMFASTTLQIGADTLTNAEPGWVGNYDLLIARFDGAGQPLWARSYPALGSQYGSKIATGPDGNIYICGAFEGVAGQLFQLGNTTLTNQGGFDGFVAKLNSNGEPVWARAFHQEGYNITYGVAVDEAGGLLALANYGPGSPAFMWLTKYDQDGEVQWHFGAPANAISHAVSVRVGLDGESYVGGGITGHGAIWKFNDRGELVWLKTTDGSQYQYFQDVALDRTGSLVAVGIFGGTNVVLDGTTLTVPAMNPDAGSLFFARLAADPPALREVRSGPDVVVSWPTNQPNFQLEANSLSLLPQDWQPVSYGPVDNRFTATNPMTGPGTLFRLHKAE
jgi:hypothetical protein